MKFCYRKLSAPACLVILALLCVLPASAIAGGSLSKDKSGGEILKWDVEGQKFKVPQDTEAANKLREDTQHRFAEGTGAYFGFTSSLELWDYLDWNLDYPDEAWKTVFPYYFGVSPPFNTAFWLEGSTVVFDDTGNLAVRTYRIFEPNAGETGQTYGTAWYCMGNICRAWESWMDEAVEVKKPYLGEGNFGIRYFLSQVHLAGVIGGPRMKALLEQVGAKELSIQRTYRDERYGVFYIPPTPVEWDNWMGELYVWVNVRNWGIERHQVDFLYGREYCQYFNQLWDVRPDDYLFYLEWLPKRILDLLDKQFQLTVTDEAPATGPDEFVEKDKYIRIQGRKGGETGGTSSDAGKGEAGKGDEGKGDSGTEGK